MVADGSWLLGSARALRRDQLGVYEQTMRTYGDIARFRIGPPRLGFEFDAVFHPEGAREVLASKAAAFVKDAPLYNEFARLFGNGLLLSNGDQWRRDRRIVAPLFTPQQIASYVGPTTEVASELVANWQTRTDGGEVVDLSGAGLDYAFAVLGRTVFGTDIGAAGPTMRAALPVLLEHAKQRGLAPVRSPANLPTPANRRADRARRDLYGVVDALIARRRNAGDADRPDLLNLLLEARDPETGVALTDDDVRDQLLVFLSAGYETTGAALAFTLHLLARHPEVQQRVRAEVCEATGSRPTELDIGRFEFTKQVINESLRLYPPAHTIVRKASSDTEILGRSVDAGRIVAVSVWGIHHHPEIWPAPHTFDPDRWEANGRHRYSHLPFGGGPRSCIAADLATEELLIAVATIIAAFDVQSSVVELDLDVDITVRPAGKLPCRVTPIDSHR